MAILTLRGITREYDGTQFSRLGMAIAFADIAHTHFWKEAPGTPQRRKYTDELYIVHPKAVANKLLELGHSFQVAMGGALHDVTEDTLITIDEIRDFFGHDIAELVVGTSDEFTKEKYPHMNRAARKLAEAKLAGTKSSAVQTIKCVDSADNLKTIVKHGAGFARKYLDEKAQLHRYLTGAHSVAHKLLADALDAGYAALRKKRVA